MTCTTAEICRVKLAVTCAAIRLSTSGLQARLKPAPLGLITLEVKSALFSLQWTTPKVPKPLNENIGVPGSSARAPAAYSAIASRAMGVSLYDMRSNAFICLLQVRIKPPQHVESRRKRPLNYLDFSETHSVL